MKLTEEEHREFDHLYSIRNSFLPLTQEQFDRLKFLSQKNFHNNCSSPICEGYEGNESETHCTKCGCLLFKTM